jgi:hypothetical protein
LLQFFGTQNLVFYNLSKFCCSLSKFCCNS